LVVEVQRCPKNWPRERAREVGFCGEGMGDCWLGGKREPSEEGVEASSHQAIE
jgi:hypothetical protein